VNSQKPNFNSLTMGRCIST